MKRLLPWVAASLVGVVFYGFWVSLDRLLGGEELSRGERAANAAAGIILVGFLIWAALHPQALRRFAPRRNSHGNLENSEHISRP